MEKHTYDCGLIGNCAYLALISKDTNVKWMCLPRFDSSFVFGALVGGEKGGEFSLKPAEGEFSSHQYYVPNTNVLVTEIDCGNSAYRITDFAPRFYQFDRYYRPLMIIRKVEPLRGLPRIRPICRPVGDYGSKELSRQRGSNHIRYLGLDESARLTTDIPINMFIEEGSFVLSTTRYIAFTYGVPLEAEIQKTSENFLQQTVNYWQRWIKSTSIGNGFQKEVIRSSLALKIHQYEDTGGIIASPTTSLPEYPGSTRNWDYRYCWMRDAYYTLTAFNNIGHFEEMEKYFYYLTNIQMESAEKVQPLYNVLGEGELIEKELDLPGYLGEKPVRVGNDAYTHVQNDVYGQIILAILPLFVDFRFNPTERLGSKYILDQVLQRIEQTIEQKDAGIWEFRGRAQQHAYTNLFQWAGASAALRIARRIGSKERAERASRLILRATELIEATFDPNRKVYTQAIGVPHLDASNLQLIMMNYLDPEGEKARSHLEAMEKELKAGKGLFYRYRHADDFGEPLSTFLICGFWYVEALACVGRLDEAIEGFEELCSFSNHVGLLSEDVHSATGSQWGNFPQAYSHVGLVNAAFRISKKLNKPGFLS